MLDLGPKSIVLRSSAQLDKIFNFRISSVVVVVVVIVAVIVVQSC